LELKLVIMNVTMSEIKKDPNLIQKIKYHIIDENEILVNPDLLG
jgi:hypothetical protein